MVYSGKKTLSFYLTSLVEQFICDYQFCQALLESRISISKLAIRLPQKPRFYEMGVFQNISYGKLRRNLEGKVVVKQRNL